jgi:hypothetical protein
MLLLLLGEAVVVLDTLVIQAVLLVLAEAEAVVEVCLFIHTT